MSAHLTVYTMAIAAEHPLRMCAAHQASRAAQVDTASGQRFGRLRRHLGSALVTQRSPRGEVVAARRTDTGPGGCHVVGQLAG